MDFGINNDLMQLLIIPLVVGLTEVVKNTDSVPRKFWSVVSIVFGLLLSLLLLGVSINDPVLLPGLSGHTSWIISGLIAGLSASGLWSGVKTLASGDNRTKREVS